MEQREIIIIMEGLENVFELIYKLTGKSILQESAFYSIDENGDCIISLNIGHIGQE
jgi:hypothetical protein